MFIHVWICNKSNYVCFDGVLVAGCVRFVEVLKNLEQGSTVVLQLDSLSECVVVRLVHPF